MAYSVGDEIVSEVVSVFDNMKQMQKAIDSLLCSGFTHNELSILADDKAIRKKLGYSYKRVQEAEDDVSAPRKPYVSEDSIMEVNGLIVGALSYAGATAGTIIVSGGAAITFIGATAGIGSGIVMGIALVNLIGRKRAKYIQQQMDKGGIILWVHTRNREYENRAISILSRNSAHDVHVHQISTADVTDKYATIEMA